MSRVGAAVSVHVRFTVLKRRADRRERPGSRKGPGHFDQSIVATGFYKATALVDGDSRLIVVEHVEINLVKP
jgi:hypothetical protein